MGVSSFEFGFAFGAIVRRLMGQGFGCFKRRSIEMLLRYIISEVRDPRDRTLKTTYYKGFSLPLFSAGFTCGSIEAAPPSEAVFASWGFSAGFTCGSIEANLAALKNRQGAVFRRFYLRLH